MPTQPAGLGLVLLMLFVLLLFLALLIPTVADLLDGLTGVLVD